MSSKQFVNQLIIGDNPPQMSHRHVIVTARKPGNKCYYKSKVQTLDPSHSGTFETAANGTEFSLQSFQKIGIFLNFRNANLRKFREESQMEQKFPVRNLKKKIGYSSRGYPLYWKFRKMLFHSPLGIPGNANRKFWSNGKSPLIPRTLHND